MSCNSPDPPKKSIYELYAKALELLGAVAEIEEHGKVPPSLHRSIDAFLTEAEK